MGTHNICLFIEVHKKCTGCNLKTTELLDCALTGVCAVIRSKYGTFPVEKKFLNWSCVQVVYCSLQVVFVGMCIMAPLWGLMGDKYGRQKVKNVLKLYVIAFRNPQFRLEVCQFFLIGSPVQMFRKGYCTIHIGIGIRVSVLKCQSFMDKFSRSIFSGYLHVLICSWFLD